LSARAVLTGTHFINGIKLAVKERWLSGAVFFAGYPITPATEIAESMSRRCRN